MKKIYLSIICFLAGILSMHAQILYGNTKFGGKSEDGTIYKFEPSTNNLVTYDPMEYHAAAPWNCDFIQASDGRLYGMTSNGGINDGRNDFGVIFCYDPSTYSYKILKNFDGDNGRNPNGRLLQATDGKLYGLALYGGRSDAGVIFSFDISSSTYTKLMDFDTTNSTNGVRPTSSLIQANDGKLYGMTSEGGTNNVGVIFSFDPPTSAYAKLHDFDRDNEGYPIDRLMQASDGKLYGMATGSRGAGIIFSFDPSASFFKKLIDLNGINDGGPTGALVQASDGKLYGMTNSGGNFDHGTIFSFDPSNSTFTKLKDFAGSYDSQPIGSLIQASNGKLYGITNGDFTGTIFSFDPSGSVYKLLVTFDNFNNGSEPSGSLMQANDGILYGMTFWGGSKNNNNGGVIYSFNPSTSIFNKLLDFLGNGGMGSNFTGSLVLASNGKIYGTAYSGGSIFNAGTIFSFDPSSLTYAKLMYFNGINGYNPNGSLLQASDGKLYGMTQNGGTNYIGVIFSFDPSTSTYTKLIDFDGINGGRPTGALVQVNNGKLYGVTQYGGTSNGGVIFSFDPATATFRKLKDFKGNDGLNPISSLIQANDGKLYGTTWSGGTGNGGVIFSFDPATASYAKLYDFGGPSLRNLIQAKDGKLYGLSYWGGNGAGVIFSFNPSTSTMINLHDFDLQNDGGNPFGNLMQSSDGKLYGMTSSGGSGGVGTIFSFDPVTSVFTKLIDYNGTNGAHPQDGNGIIEVNKCIGSDSTWYKDADGDGYGNPAFRVKACPKPAGYVADSTDCDDNNKAIHPVTWYRDFDNDGYGNRDRTLIVCGDMHPAGYVRDSTDCNDFDESVHAPITYYRDFDGDGFGDPNEPSIACSSYPPGGLVVNNTDCNDHDKAVHAPITYYRDADHDGFGDPYHPVSICSNVPPAGYVKNNYDCYDCEGGNSPGQVRVRMCHDGWTQCIYLKDTTEKLRLGWSMGICPLQSCAADETLMCHNGKQECVKTKDVAAKLAEPGGKWSLGPYCSGVPISKSGSSSARKIEKTSTEKSTPTQYSLSNHPNPFAGTSIIKYELPLDSKVSIKVYDLAGRTVATLVDEYKKAGIYTVNFNAQHLSNGSLFYKIIARSKDGQYEQTNQMVKIK